MIRQNVQVSRACKGRNAYINLIPYNSVDEADFKSSSDKNSLRFYDMLMKLNVKATLRAKHGDDIEAACGQLTQAERKL